MNKKDKELNIVSKIYDLEKYNMVNRKIEEKPDFILKRFQFTIGVEVTEYYQNQGDARLKNYPNYFNKVIGGNADKRDKEYLTIPDDVSFFNEQTKKWESLPGNFVASKEMTLMDYIAILKKIVEKKNELAKDYDKSCNNLNLIIYDGDSRFYTGSQENIEKVAALVCTHLKSIAIKSSYDVIFILFNINGSDASLAITKDGNAFYNFRLNTLNDIDFFLNQPESN